MEFRNDIYLLHSRLFIESVGNNFLRMNLICEDTPDRLSPRIVVQSQDERMSSQRSDRMRFAGECCWVIQVRGQGLQVVTI